MSFSLLSMEDDVFSLSSEEFEALQIAVSKRTSKEKYGFCTLEEAAQHFERKIKCPKCDSDQIVKDGKTDIGKQRYYCTKCGKHFIYLTKSIFSSTKKDFDTWAKYVGLLMFNPTLELCEYICNISHKTAFLWRHKIFQTVNNYQDNLLLRDKIWIDETYITDSSIIKRDDYQSKRGLSKNKICIVVAIDVHKNIVVKICGHGKPSYKRLKNALATHIKPGSVIVHDGERSHDKLIQYCRCTEEFYKANTKDPEYLKHMNLLNNLCAWIKRYLFKYIGMKIDNLQTYLNWYVYLFRVKRDNEKYPEIERVIRHLVLSEEEFKRK